MSCYFFFALKQQGNTPQGQQMCVRIYYRCGVINYIEYCDTVKVNACLHR